jgi:hypothetical protein
MSILGLDAVNRFFDNLSLGWTSFWNLWGVLGLALIFVVIQLSSIWAYTKLIGALIRFKPKVEQFVRNVMLFFD